MDATLALQRLVYFYPRIVERQPLQQKYRPDPQTRSSWPDRWLAGVKATHPIHPIPFILRATLPYTTWPFLSARYLPSSPPAATNTRLQGKSKAKNTLHTYTRKSPTGQSRSCFILSGRSWPDECTLA